MKKIVSILVCYLLFTIYFPAFSLATNQQTDSLLSLLKKDKEDTNKVNHLNDLSREYINMGSYDSALIYANQAIQLINSPPGKQWNKEVAGKLLASAYNNIGILYKNQGNYPKALENYFIGLKIDEKLKNNVGVAKRLGNIGLVYSEQKDYSKALDYYFRALKIDKEQGNKKGMAIRLSNIGIVYYEQAKAHPDTLQRERLYQMALDYYFKALKLDEELGRKSGIAVNLGNIGIVYRNQNDHSKAMEYYLKALKMKEELGDKSGIAIWLGNIGLLHLHRKNFIAADSSLHKALQLSEQIGDWVGIQDINMSLSTLYAKQEKWKLAFKHYKKYIVAHDSIKNEENTKKQTRLEMTYEFEKKEAAAAAERQKQEAVAAAEKRKQQLVLISVISGLLLVVVFAGFIFRALRITQKQKKVIEEQKKIVEEKQKEILDSIRYAKRIQTALLPTEKYIDKHLKRLMKK